MASIADIISTWVCPAAGVIIITLAFCSPLKSVLQIDRQRSLGEANALPYAVMFATSVSWMLYGILVHNFFVYCGNVAGVLLGLYYTLVCYKYSNEKAQNTLTYILMAASALFFATGLVSMAAPLDQASIETLWGSVSVAFIVVYYASPLATLAKVLRERNSSSLHWAMCTMNTVNGALWFVYGLAVKDMYICIPNGAGVAFNLLCVVMCFIFPRNTASSHELHVSAQAAADCWATVSVQSTQPSKDDGKGGAVVTEGQDIQTGDQGQQQAAAARAGDLCGSDVANGSGESSVVKNSSSDDVRQMAQLMPGGEVQEL